MKFTSVFIENQKTRVLLVYWIELLVRWAQFSCCRRLDCGVVSSGLEWRPSWTCRQKRWLTVYQTVRCRILLGAKGASGLGQPNCQGCTITFRQTAVGRTSLNGWSARRRDLYLTTLTPRGHWDRQYGDRTDKITITRSCFLILLVYIICAVAQSVEALRYKPEGRGFDSRWCHWNFSLT
jgi:hypothetical protein